MTHWFGKFNALILWRDYEFVYGLLSQLMLYHSLLFTTAWLDRSDGIGLHSCIRPLLGWSYHWAMNPHRPDLSPGRTRSRIAAFQAARKTVYRQATICAALWIFSRTIMRQNAGSSLLKVSCLVHTSHIIRAILFARATVALLSGYSLCIHVSSRVSRLSFAVLRRAINAARRHE